MLDVIIWLFVVGGIIAVFASLDIPWYVWLIALILWWSVGFA
jgi:hypothetical protein